jgi:hypothetical protein
VLIDVPNALDDAAGIAGWFGSLGPAEDVSLTKAGQKTYGLSLRVGTDYRP